jgi:8-oxo-dGTP pyrophosphatase MutT (NUDIX family)
MIQRGHHDMGGLPGGKVEPTEHDYPEWERRVDAMSWLMRAHGITVDERRRHIEQLPPDAYDRMSYYERWIVSLTQAALQRGLVSSEELARKMVEVERRGAR